METQELTTKATKWKTLDLAYIGLFVALMAVCAWINIPTPWDISFTLQTFGVFCAVAILGLGRGTTAVVIYILLGLIGVPVFAGFSSGVSALLGSTGGYIIGFIFSALVMGGILKAFGKKIWVMIIAMVLGLVVCYAFGTAWFVVVYTRKVAQIGVWAALCWCVIPYIIPDLCKIAVAILVEKRVGPYINRRDA
jgi:biotin transport system substrate-specific component